MVQNIFKDTERQGQVRWVGFGLLKLIQLPIQFSGNFFALLADTRNHTDPKNSVMIQSRVNCEANVTKRMRPSLR